MSSRSLGSLTLDLILKLGGFEQGMDKAARLADKRTKEMQRAFTGAFKAIGGTIAGFVAGLATVDTAIRGFMQAVDVADRVDELSARLGISTEILSEWGYAAKLSGSDLESLANAIPKLSKTLASAADEGSKQGQLFKALGVDVKDAAGNLRDVEQIIPEIADAFKRLNNDTLEAALAQELFGRSGAELLEFLNRGGDGIRELGDELRDLGGVIDAETGAKAAAFKDEVDRLRVAINGVWTEIAGELLPVLTDLVTEFKETSTAGDGVAKTAKDIAEIASVLAGLIRAVRGEFSKADEVGTSFRDTLSFIGEAFESMRSAASSVFRLDIGGWFDGVTEAAGDMGRAIKAAFGQLEKPDFSNVVSGPNFSNVRSGVRSVPTGRNEAENRLNRLLSGEGKGSNKSGKSDAEREAEQLQRAYDSLMESMRERIALFNTEGEAAKVRYDLEHGALKSLDDAKKQALITEAEAYDLLVKRREEDEARLRMAEEESDRIREGLEYGKQVLADLQFELELMRMTNAERATAIQLRGMEAEAVAEYGEAIAQANRDIEESMKQVQLMDGFRSEFANFFEDVIGGTKSVKDAFTDMLDNINRMIVQRISENWVEQLFGNFGSSGGGSAGGNWFSAIASWFGGGKAGGGWASPYRMYEVNERGLEMATVNGRDFMLTGSKPVEITPNHQLGGGRTQNITQNFYTKRDRKSAAQQQQEASFRLRMASARG